MSYRKRIKKLNDKKYKRRRMSALIAIICLIVGVSIHKTAKYISKKKSEKNVKVLVQKKADNIKNVDGVKSKDKQNQKKQINPNEILRQANVTVSGNKYTYDAKEVEEALKNNKKDIDGKKIAFLTFDDGPSTTVTPKVLKVLKENNVKATFFIVGSCLDETPRSKELLKQIVLDGNAIGNHTYTHDYSHLYPRRHVSAKNFMDEINKTEKSIQAVLGKDFHTRVIRFPGGHMSWKGTEQIDKIMKDKNYAYIDWNSLTGDAEGRKKTPEQLYYHLKREVSENYKPDRLVVLMHDTYGKENTARALQNVITYLKSLGYEFKTLK